MKCKSLILGPAAALLVAPSGALAADAMMKDDMGPVTVCEAYGSGYFFSPGTETCLKISGDVRVQFESDSSDDPAVEDRWNWDWRGEVNIHAMTETELGVLASRIRFNGTNEAAGKAGAAPNAADGSANVNLTWAALELGGFRIGRRDGFWTEYAFGYYNARYSGLYESDGTAGMLADYTFRGNGFSATFGVSENPDDFDFHAGGSWSSGGLLLGVVWFNTQAGPATTATQLSAGDPGEGGNAWRVVGEYGLSFVAPGAKVRGWYGSDGGETNIVKGSNWGVTGAVGLGEDLTLFAGYSQAEDETLRPDLPNVPATGTALSVMQMSDVLAATPEDRSHFSIGLTWTPVPGLAVQPEYTFTDYDQSDVTGMVSGGGTRTVSHVRPDMSTFGVRITRSF